MADVEFTEPFAEQFGEIVVIVDMRQEAAVAVGEFLPVDTVHVCAIEALALFAFGIVEHIAAFGGRIEGLACVVGDIFKTASAAHLFQGFAEYEYCLAVGRSIESCVAVGHALGHFKFFLAHVVLPQVGSFATFGFGYEVKSFSVGVDNMVEHVDRHRRYPYEAICDAFDVNVKRLVAVRSFFVGIFVFLFLFLEQFHFFFAHAVAAVCVIVEKCEHHIHL